MLTQFENIQIQTLEMLLEISERTLPAGRPRGLFELKVSMADLKKFSFKYQGGDDRDFYKAYNLFKERGLGLIDFKASDPDLLQSEYNSGYSDINMVSTPAYVVTISAEFVENAKVLLHDLRTQKNIKPGQIAIYWNSEYFELSRFINDEKKSYKIKKSKESLDKRRILVAELFKNPTGISVEILLKKLEFELKDFRKNVEEINSNTDTKLETKGRNLILNKDWTEVSLNTHDFYLE